MADLRVPRGSSCNHCLFLGLSCPLAKRADSAGQDSGLPPHTIRCAEEDRECEE